MYNMDKIIYDIAIIRLPEKLTFNEYIRPICLPNRKYLAETYENQVILFFCMVYLVYICIVLINFQAVQVPGWGITADRGKVSPILQYTNVTILSNGKCRQVFRDLLTGNNICVKATPTASPCRGDSGNENYTTLMNFC